MAVLEILTIPDPRLKHKSSKVDDFDKKLELTVKNMFDTLRSKIANTTAAAINGLTGLGFLGAITFVILVKEFRDRNEK